MLLAQRVSLNNVTKDLDERTRTLPYMVEQRAQDNKRIAQIQAENTELLKRTDSNTARIPVLEERLQRLEKSLQRIQPSPSSFRRNRRLLLKRRSSLKLSATGEIEDIGAGVRRAEDAHRKTDRATS